MLPATLLLAVAASLAAAQTAPVADEILEFDPPLSQFRLQETRDAPTPLRIRLRSRPSAPATIYLESANLKFDMCAVPFRPNTYDQWQTVNIRGLPYFTDADRERNEVIAMRMSCPRGGGDWHGRNWTYPVERPAGVKGATCTSNGDPHITTFDGKYYDYQGLGTFYLVKSPVFTIQTVTDTWKKATVSVATAIRYGPAHFIVDSRETDPEKRLVRLSGETPGIDVVVSTDNTEFRFRFPDGTAVTIRHQAGQIRNYLNHQIDVPAHLSGRTLGLCGTFTTNVEDDWTTADGTVATNPNQFGDTWRVPATDDMFICKDACPDHLNTKHVIKPADQCLIPASLSGDGLYVDNQPGYIPFRHGRGTYKAIKPRYDRTMPRFFIPDIATDADFDAQAEAACNEAFDLPEARDVLDPTHFIQSCIMDCRITRSMDMVDASKVLYLDQVYSRIRPVVNLAAMSPARRSGYANSPEVTMCRRAIDALGLGSRNCPNNCSGNGRCTKGGCVCRPGFTGPRCGRRLSAYGARGAVNDDLIVRRPGNSYAAPVEEDALYDAELDAEVDANMNMAPVSWSPRPFYNRQTPAWLNNQRSYRPRQYRPWRY